MNWIDIAIGILVIFQAATGFGKGIARSLLDLAGIVAAVVISLTQFGLVSDFIGRMTGISTGWLHWFSLFVCLVLSLALANVVTGVAGRSLRGASKSLLDRVAGFLLGGARGCVIASLLLILYAFMPFSGTAKTQLDRSSLAPETMSIIPAIIDTVMDRVAPGSPPIMEKLARYLLTR
ncbi:MAG: CvpA family protein [Gemmatimonadetes bacterium]|nr:CvpA family protein [Gemmatimonadota bacterium]MYB62128.1 CvpA family protein [Gemmatimonadota bacterium]